MAAAGRERARALLLLPLTARPLPQLLPPAPLLEEVLRRRARPSRHARKLVCV